LILSKFFYSPTDAQVNYLKNNIRIYIKTAPTSGSSLFVLPKVTAITLASTNTTLPDDGVTAPKHVGAV
jgi:hypothetical protein